MVFIRMLYVIKNRMKLTLSIIVLFLSTVCLCQEHIIETEIKSQNIFELSIIQVYPDSFPNVSVVFQAKNKDGKPLWKLDKSEVSVTENNQDCDVVRLVNISNTKPLNIGLVFDHSGSMVDNPAQFPDSVESMQDWYFNGIPLPKDYTMAIDFAKEGIIEFLNETENTSDSILFIGFSSEVDKVLPLTSDMSGIKSFVKNVLPHGRTSFYDALYLSIDSLSLHTNQPVIVALTDGQDNESEHSYQDVINYANARNIVIYIIGLGNAYEYPLKQLTEKTNGFYYYTNDPKTLIEIYRNIKAQLKSIYQLDYTSSNFDYTENERNIIFSFVNDTLTFSDNYTYYSLPEETLEYLKLQEEQRLKEFRDNLILPISLGSIFLLGIGSFLISRRKKKTKPVLNKLFPNPFENDVTIEFEIPTELINPTLNIYDSKGFNIKSENLSNLDNSKNINLSDLTSGIYVINISSEKKKSNSLKIIKK
jgi:Ca-activated chloride channel family protein